ncbi:MAG: IS200/IS605 family transposase [Anaerolineae bacterium]
MGEVKDYFRELVEEVARKRGYKPVVMETMPNHVHFLLTKPPWEDLSRFVKNLKGVTARRIFQRFPGLKLDMRSNHFWTRGYQYVKHEGSSLPTVIAYIRDQKRMAGLVD